MIKLLIGGSPCTYWSIAQKNGRETEAEGMGWELFKNYLIAKEKFKPDYFLYENNKSAAQAIKDQISYELGVDLMHINSALVSAQNRRRFYAFNWKVDQPEDRGIVLRDILESGVVDREKSYPLLVSHQGNARDYFKKQHAQVIFEPTRIPEYGVTDKSRPVTASYAYKGDGEGSLVSEAFPDNPNKQVRDYVAEPVRIGDIGTYENVGECETIQKAIPKLVDKFGYVPEKFNAYNLAEIEDKSPTLSTGSMVTSSCATTIFDYPHEPIWMDWDKKQRPVYEVKNGLITIKGKQYPIKLADGYYIIRKLTPVECERLQTLPDGYTRAVSNAQRYKGLGNGWTAEVIIHILNGVLKDVPRDEEIVVLSMYDGIGTGSYCLDKMGFTNVKYFAYEIDKYAKQVAMSNYPDIIQMGDAFDLRHPDWTIGY